MECKFENLLWGDDERYTCVITSASIREPRKTIKAITGVHIAGKTNNYVTAIWFKNTVVEHFPHGLAAIYPRLVAVEIDNCGLQKISRADLAGLEKLIFLNLPGNKLASLPDNLFKSTPNLQRINFNQNNLGNLSAKLLEPLNAANLIEIHFEKNRTIDASFEKGRSLTLETLKRMIENYCEPPSRTQRVVKQGDSVLLKLMGYKANGKLTDITIFAKGKDFKVHKAVLAAQSSVFENMFTNENIQGEQISQKIKNFGVETFGEFLDFFYSGQVQENFAIELFELANEFDVPTLKNVCEEIIFEILDESNALEIYNLGHERKFKALKRGAFAELMKIHPELDESMLDAVEIVNDFINTKRRLGELKQSSKDRKDKK